MISTRFPEEEVDFAFLPIYLLTLDIFSHLLTSKVRARDDGGMVMLYR